MQRSSWTTGAPVLVAGLLSSGLLLAGCASPTAEAESGESGPAIVEAVEGTDVSRVTITELAADRLDLQTTEVVEELVAPRPGTTGARTERKIVPYGAVMYDNAGDTWAYVVEEPLVFVREPIEIDYVVGDKAVLRDGPDVGTEVVTLGAAELYGAELGLGQ